MKRWLHVAMRVVVGLALLTAWSALMKFILDHRGSYLSATLAVPAQFLMLAGGALLLWGFASWVEQRELEPIRQRGTEIRQRLGAQRQPEVFDTVQLGLNQLEEYYTINKGQARNSFRFSILAVVAGLGTVLGGVWLFYLKKLDAPFAAVSAMAGIVLQFIGGAGFYLYNKSIEQLSHFHDRLIRMQETMLAVALCEQIKDDNRRESLKERMVLELVAATHGAVASGPREPLKDAAKAGPVSR